MWASILSLSFLASLLVYAYNVLANFQQSSSIDSKQVLILTAHPDDECMFFGPTITALRSVSKTRVHVLCLSTGNADGLGVTRKKELTRSCQVLGIPPSNVKALDHAELQDGMKNTWSPSLIATIIKDYVSKHKIDTMITFDDYGVSGHPNHIAAYNGARHFIESCKDKIKLYTLSSILLPRKYIGIGDLVFMTIEKRLFHNKKKEENEEDVVFVSSPLDYLISHKAMRRHDSQLVWFRWLYVTFSRYMFVNQLVAVNSVAHSK
ncbi:putative deacetylase LmbE-like domain-containing protein [Phascolomyces articulosus]|uniref:N-acetylglucosaminylphosphatidylinositol deacetylase n=1 Tax=Phascolomyces articulosus TaxID=60185 RepID=A0AAD5PC86_9FUNG|nr:putative deacetylase LmbE-like domain-containing protein [Phascolomyces articulosus]